MLCLFRRTPPRSTPPSTPPHPPPPSTPFSRASVHLTSRGKQTSNVIPLLCAQKAHYSSPDTCIMRGRCSRTPVSDESSVKVGCSDSQRVWRCDWMREYTIVAMAESYSGSNEEIRNRVHTLVLSCSLTPLCIIHSSVSVGPAPDVIK